MHKGTVGRVHESDDAVVDGAVQNRRNLDHAIGFGRERETREFRNRLFRLLRIREKHPHVPILILAGVGRDADLFGLERGPFHECRNMAAAATGIELPSVIGAFDALSIKVSERERHAAMGAYVAHRRHLALAVTADEDRLS